MATKKTTDWQVNPYRERLTDLKKKISKAYKQLEEDRNKPIEVLMKDRNELILLLSECNYIARECERFKEESEKKE